MLSKGQMGRKQPNDFIIITAVDIYIFL
jgi:hypothetical protein